MPEQPAPSPIRAGLTALLSYGTPLYAFLAFSGATIYWVVAPYDQMRILQVLLLLLLGGYALANRTPIPTLTKLPVATGFWLMLGLILLSVYDSAYSGHAAADAALFGLLAAGVWAQALLLRHTPARAANIAALLALAPLLTVIYLPISLVSEVHSSVGTTWHQSFSNIRMLDDALLPGLFLLWQRPAWLAHDNRFSQSWRQIAVTCAVGAVSTLYLLAFFLDGSRAGLLAIGVGIVVAALLRTPIRRLALPLLSLLLAGGLYVLLCHTMASFVGHDLIRTDSSLRDQLWQKALTLWQSHPLLGIGGDNFALAQPWLLNAHPHNLIVQWISEWGIAGLLALLLLLPLTYALFKQRKRLPSFALGALVAVGLDSLLSGVLVYPLSQMLALWVLAWLIAQLPVPVATPSVMKQAHLLDDEPTLASTGLLPFKAMILIAMIAMLTVHGRDMVCIDCLSLDHENAPRFWQFGRALHLLPPSAANGISPADYDLIQR
jgi:O-antigen ligase